MMSLCKIAAHIIPCTLALCTAACLLPGAAVAHTIEGEKTLYVADEAQELRSALLEWSASLKSFSGTYTLSQRWPGEPVDPDRPALDLTITFRFQGDDRYLERTEEVTTTGGSVVRKYARYKGNVISRNDFNHPEGVKEDYVYVQKGVVNEWPEPVGAYLNPREIFNAGQSPSLADFMASGETLFFERSGYRVLVHRQGLYGRDVLRVWFENTPLPIRFEWGYGITVSHDQLATVWPGDPFDEFDLNVTWELGNYETIDGVAFPTWAQKIWWAYDPGVMKRLDAQFRAGKYPDVHIFQRDTIAQAGKPYERSVQDFHLKAGRINPPLTAADFRIDIPVGAILQQSPGQVELDIYLGPWYARIFEPVPLAIIGGVCVLLLALGWWYRRRRHA